jgi:hypothetical protein
MRELSASPVLTFPGGKAMPALVASQTGMAVTGGDGQIPDAGRTRGAGPEGLPDAGRAAVRPLEGQRQYENAHSPRLAGGKFPRLAGLSGWR